MQVPSITIITSTLNPHLRTFTRVLDSIKRQRYEGKIEHLVLDGGTTNGGIELAKRYGCHVLPFHNSPDEGGSRLYTGLQQAKGEIILILQSDNILPHTTWLQKMVQPFAEKKVFATYPAYNAYQKSDSLLTKYTALFGSPDPTLYYLHKSDKIPVYYKEYDKGEIIEKGDNFWLVKFSNKSLPTMGDNGFFVKKSVLKQFVKKNKTYIHVDTFFEMLEKGYDTYGVVKDKIIHTTHERIFDFFKRRIAVKQNFYDTRRGKRKYLVYNPYSLQDKLNLLKYILFSLTFIVPFIEALRGFISIREKAWFLHPAMCCLMVLGYGISEIEWFIKKQFKLL